MRSVKMLAQRGYVGQGTPEYILYWKTMLSRARKLFATKAALRRGLAEVMGSNPDITEQEAYCALADARGDAAGAVGNLKHRPFLEEVRAMARIFDVPSYATGQKPHDGLGASLKAPSELSPVKGGRRGR